MLFDFFRKKGRTGAGLYRSTPEPAVSPGLPRMHRLLVLLAYVVLVGTLTQYATSGSVTTHGDSDLQGYAKEDVIADYYFQAIDLKATEETEDEAADDVAQTYRVASEAVRNQVDLVRQRVSTLLGNKEALAARIREALRISTSAQSDEEIFGGAVREFADRLKESSGAEAYPDADLLAFWLMPTSDSLPLREFAELDAEREDGQENPLPVKALTEAEGGSLVFAYADDLTAIAVDALDYVLSSGVIRGGAIESSADESLQILRERTVGDQKVSEKLSTDKILTPDTARLALTEKIRVLTTALSESQPDRPVDWAVMRKAANAMVHGVVVATLQYDEVVTSGDREKARGAVEPVMKEIEPGQLIIGRGSRWTEQSRSDVKTYWAKLERGQEQVVSIFGSVLSNMIIVGLVLLCLIRSTRFLISREEGYLAQLSVSLLLICAILVVGRVVSYFDDTGLSVPVLAVAILLAILTNARLAMLAGLLAAALVSVQFGYNWNVLAVGAAMSVAGVFSIYVVRRRSDMARAALQATGVGVLMLCAISLATDSLFSEQALQRTLLILLNGGICLFLVPGLLSPLERLFGITTDIQLLEYSDLNSELLSRLAIEVPATYSHSLMLGQLAEAACDAVGANGLKARVCAYFHDIGKMRRPEYFSENQTGANIHDDLSPRLSARAIASHVTEGVEMAREYHLPKPIIDGISEHHGTMLISFFYQEALHQQKHGDIREEDYRYPGPKPQSRETAILMICDGAESGVRTIKNPNEERIREFVDKIISTRADDRQFDECDLNLKELDIIRDAITRRLCATLHTRVTYPERAQGIGADNVIPMSGGRRE